MTDASEPIELELGLEQGDPDDPGHTAASSPRGGARRPRLDRAIATALEARGLSISRAQVSRAFAAGDVRDGDGRALKPAARVDRPLRVVMTLPQVEPLSAEPEDLPLDVMFEDEHLLVVNKPAHMAVHPGPGHPGGTLVNAVVHHLGAQASALPVLPGNESYRPGLVHRLDRDTSGVMVLAKHMKAMHGLAERFRVHDMERVYLGVVQGVPRQLEPGAAIRVSTGHARDPADRRRFAPAPPGPGVREAVSVIRLERALGDDAASLLSFRLETGRTHQIRMHARHLGHPILGDELYGGRLRDSALGAAVGQMGRQALHAAVLGFPHPISGEALRFEAPLPEEIRTLVRALMSP